MNIKTFKMDHPIIFSTPMVQAILADRKTQTRRIVKPQPDNSGLWNDDLFPRSIQSDLTGWNGTVDDTGESKQFKCPYGDIGHKLWVRETFEVYVNNNGGEDLTTFKLIADDTYFDYPTSIKPGRHPSIHLPKVAARTWLEVVSVRVEKLLHLSSADAIAEGIEPEPTGDFAFKNYMYKEDAGMYRYVNPLQSFKSLWHSLHGTDSWKANPWVWVISLKKITNHGARRTAEKI